MKEGCTVRQQMSSPKLGAFQVRRHDANYLRWNCQRGGLKMKTAVATVGWWLDSCCFLGFSKTWMNVMESWNITNGIYCTATQYDLVSQWNIRYSSWVTNFSKNSVRAPGSRRSRHVQRPRTSRLNTERGMGKRMGVRVVWCGDGSELQSYDTFLCFWTAKTPHFFFWGIDHP